MADKFNNVTAARVRDNTPTLNSFLAASDISNAGLTDFDESGQSRYLPSNSVTREVDNWLYFEAAIRAAMTEIVELKSAKATASKESYTYLYADVSETPTVLLFNLKGVSPLPTDISQVDVSRNGDELIPEIDFTFGTSGIFLTTDLTAGEWVKIKVMSPSLASGKSDFYWYAEDAVGVGGISAAGNNQFALEYMPEDMFKESIADYPSAAARMDVWLNGNDQTINIDYTVTGTGASTVLNFTNSLLAKDTVHIRIWRS
jgi:hypothetical protein